MSINCNEFGIWQISIRTPSGRRIRQSAKTKNRQEAQELHDKLKHESWRIEQLGERQKRTWDEACVRWINESEKKTLNDDLSKIRLLPEFRGMILDDLSRDFIHSTVNKKTCSKSTKNRYFALIRAILKKCVDEWNWVEKIPKIKMHKEPKKRIRWLYPEEAQRLVNALSPTPHLQYMVIFSLSTGLRQANVLGLKWEQIDLKRQVAWIYPDEAKAGNAIGVPLNNAAMNVLLSQPKISNHVFTGKTGKPINAINSRTWANALERASIENFRWHDLRHTWASWLVQQGTPLAALKEMGGWETLEMVQRYAHLAPEHLSQHAQSIETDIVPKFGLVQDLDKLLKIDRPRNVI